MLLGVAVVACQLIVGIEEVEKVKRPDLDAGADVEIDTFIPDPCQHATVVPPPAVDDDPTTELPPFVIAMDTFVFRPDPDAGVPIPGYDLDGICSCDTRPGADARSPCVLQGQIFCDDDGGVDNQFQKAFTFVDLLPQTSLQETTKRIGQGKQTILAFIRKYNGRPNDRVVEVSLIPSFGIRQKGCSDSQPDPTNPDGGAPWTPTWCGDDPWSTPPGALVGGFPPSPAQGYVTEGKLIVQLDRSTSFLFAGASLELGSPIASGRLIPLGEDLKDRDPKEAPRTEREKRLWRFADGIIAGRVAATDILSTAGQIVAPGGTGLGPDGGNLHLCRSPLYLAMSGPVCANLDIARNKLLDFQPNYACDAVSVTVQFTGRPALAVGEFLEQTDYNECAPVDGGPLEPSPYAGVYACVKNDGGP